MSKTVDDLMVVYDLAFGDAVNATESWNQAIGHRAGIAAVIRVLRDEFTKLGTLEFQDGWAVLRKFDEILGDAGNEKVAGTDTAQPEAIERSTPATDPAPAVCEWREVSTDALGYAWMNSSCGLVDFHERNIKQTPDGLRCHGCGKPIVFTEAKP